MDCLFCKIAAGEIPSAKVYEDDRVLVFKDINPVAPVHLLAIPKEHIQSVDAVDASNCELVGYIFTVIAKVAKEQGLTNGYRVVSNIGADGGQSVPHLHFHGLACLLIRLRRSKNHTEKQQLPVQGFAWAAFCFNKKGEVKDGNL